MTMQDTDWFNRNRDGFGMPFYSFCSYTDYNKPVILTNDKCEDRETQGASKIAGIYGIVNEP